MLGWLLLASYSPVAGLLAGIATGAGVFGLGLFLLDLRIQLTEPWRGATAYLLGILSASLVFQLVAMAGLAYRPVLLGMWLAMVLAGGVRFVIWARGQTFPRHLVVGVLLAAHVLVAVAPLSHQDELNYHALVAARIVRDHGLVFYTAPWEAAVWPQLGWHVLQAPLFAAGLPQASAVFSCFTAAVLVWFAASLIPERRLAVLCCAALLAQGFSITNFTSMGPHAFGYFAGAVALLAMIRRPAGAAYIMPIAACAMAAGKLTMVPAAVVLCLAALRLQAWRAALAALLFLGPICLWTFLAWKPFPPEAAAVFAAMRTLSLTDDTFLPLYEAANWGALLWLGCAAYFVFARRTAEWWTAALLLVLQCLLLWFAAARQLRFLGGLQVGLCIAGAAAAGKRYSRWLWLPVIPWACLVLWIASAFFPILSPRTFLARNTGLFRDYEALDRILPRDAVILQGRSRTDPRQVAWLSKPPAFYSPRPMLFQTSQVQGGAPVYMLYVEGAGRFDPWLPEGYRVGERVYANPAARFYPNRTPAATSDLEPIAVYRLIRVR